MEQIHFPDAVRAALWSYDMDRLELGKHGRRIISNVLDKGSHEALVWLFANYPREAIIAVAQEPPPGEWSRRSLAFWSAVFDIVPLVRKRF